MSIPPQQTSVNIQQIRDVVSDVLSSSFFQVDQVKEVTFTSVYRIVYEHETFYMRLLPNPQDSFATEVTIHAQLSQMPVKVPKVIHYEHYNQILGRSIMIIDEIKGRPVSESSDLNEDQLQAIVMEAGRDLAYINSLPVDGFGWMRSPANTSTLVAPYPTFRACILENWEEAMSFLAQQQILSLTETEVLVQVPDRYASWLESEQAHLAHGDFSIRHIYQDNGQYTGIIDFGDSRGANGWYDLGYFHMREQGILPYRFLPALLHGYNEVTSLPSEHEHRICFVSLLILVPVLAHSLQKRVSDHVIRQRLQRLRDDLSVLHQLER